MSDVRVEELLRASHRGQPWLIESERPVMEHTGGVVGHVRRSPLRAAVAAMRPKQWMKNGLVFAAPVGVGQVLHGPVVGRVALCFVAMSLIASATYLINDARDADADRVHPTKRFRPIAAGELSLSMAMIESALLGIAGMLAGYMAGGVHMCEILGAYVAISLAYSLWLKNEEVICMACVASCFLIRVLAGAEATHAAIPHAMLLTTGFGALFMVVGKRFAEYRSLGEDRGAHRPTLSIYTEPYLRAMFYLSATATVLMYCWWTIERTKMASTPDLCFELSMIPAVVMVMRYSLLVEHGQGGSPEELVLSDRQIQVLGLLAAGLFVVGGVIGVPH